LYRGEGKGGIVKSRINIAINQKQISEKFPTLEQRQKKNSY